MTEEDISRAMTVVINLDSLVCWSCGNVADYRMYKEELFYIRKVLREAQYMIADKKGK